MLLLFSDVIFYRLAQSAGLATRRHMGLIAKIPRGGKYGTLESFLGNEIGVKNG